MGDNNTTSSQFAIQNSIAAINSYSSEPYYSILIPSRPFESFEEKKNIPKPNSMGLFGLFEYGLNIFKDISRGNKGELANEVKDIVQKQLDNEGGQKKDYVLRVRIDGNNEVQMHSLLPNDAPIIGHDSDHYEEFTLHVQIYIPPQQAENYDYIQQQLEIAQDKLNAAAQQKRDIEKFERDVPNFAERALERMNEYKDPPSDNDLDEIGRTA